MTAISGIAGPRSRESLERACRQSLEAQSLYSRRSSRLASAKGATFGAALFPTTPEDAKDVQPLSEGGILLVADARIDNRNELLSALNDPALSKTSADSDILMAGWLRWKHGLLARLVGSYAFAVFDAADARVVLARGPAGDRPLCYRLSNGELRFASMPSGVADEKKFEPNLAWFASSILHFDTPIGQTPFQSVATVPPAHFLEWTAQGCRLARFWSPPPVDHRKTGDVIEEFRENLSRSVECRLRRIESPVASHLSSGLDSGGVTATAVALLARRTDLLAFTMAPAPGLPTSCPPGMRADETELAADAAKFLGIEQRIVWHSGPLLDCLRGHARTYQEPVHNVLNHPWAQAIDENAAASGAKVLLSATQGNASFSYGSVVVLREMLKRGRFLDYFRRVRQVVHSGPERWRGVAFYSLYDLLPKRITNPLVGMLPSTPADFFIRAEWKERVPTYSIDMDFLARGVRRDQYWTFAHHDPGIFTKATLAENGIDERDPGADQRLVEFCLSLPAEQYVGNGFTRRLARQGLADRLPASILRNRVRGYQGADWFAKLDRVQASNWVEEISASHFASELLDFPALRGAIENWDRLTAYTASELRDWGNRFTRALAFGAFLHELERDYSRIGRKA